MDVDSKSKQKSSYCLTFIYAIIYTLTLTLLFLLLKLQSSPSNLLVLSASTFSQNRISPPVTFFPLKDLRYPGSAMNGNTWFMSSLNDTIEGDEAEYLHFSAASKGMVLCIKGRDTRDGSRNSYALAFPKGLPEGATLMKGLTFVSDTNYDYGNLWHGLNAMVPFVGWSMKNKCAKPRRWVLFHWGELRIETGSWLRHLMEANFGKMAIEGFGGSEGEGGSSYCFKEAVVMRHNLGRMGREKKIMISELLRCKAREACGIINKKKIMVNEKGEPIIRMTLLMRKGSRSFKNESIVVNVFDEECRRVNGCTLTVVRSDRDQSFCDQVKAMTETDIVASPHGAQLTNMLFMDKGSSVMEFFPRGWREYAGAGQYAHHWMAALSGMKHQGAWWEPLEKRECPIQYNNHQCFHSTYNYKNGQVGHNETYFSEWARNVLFQVRQSKLQQLAHNNSSTSNRPDEPNACIC